jgi:hypothetical protein
MYAPLPPRPPQFCTAALALLWRWRHGRCRVTRAAQRHALRPRRRRGARRLLLGLPCGPAITVQVDSVRSCRDSGGKFEFQVERARLEVARRFVSRGRGEPSWHGHSQEPSNCQAESLAATVGPTGPVTATGRAAGRALSRCASHNLRLGYLFGRWDVRLGRRRGPTTSSSAALAAAGHRVCWPRA